jgi:hypothetical protein
MAGYSATIASPRSADEVFAYLADFSSVADWDPSVSESVHRGGGDPLSAGASFRVTIRTSVGSVVLNYETVELDRPGRIVLRGENRSMVSLDTISIAERPGGGSEVTYSAEIELKGVFRLGEPVLRLGFKRLGDRARDGLRARLNEGWG